MACYPYYAKTAYASVCDNHPIICAPSVTFSSIITGNLSLPSKNPVTLTGFTIPSPLSRCVTVDPTKGTLTFTEPGTYICNVNIGLGTTQSDTSYVVLKWIKKDAQTQNSNAIATQTFPTIPNAETWVIGNAMIRANPCDSLTITITSFLSNTISTLPNITLTIAKCL